MMYPNQQPMDATPTVQPYTGGTMNAAVPPPSPSLLPRPNMMPMNATASSSPTPTAAAPTQNSPQVAPMTPTAPQPAAVPAASPPSVGYGQTSSFSPSSNLIGTQIAPGAESNRVDLAKQALETYKTQQLPQFQHDLRSTIGNNAAMGRLGSGMLNTDVGNLDLAQQRDYNATESNLLNNALGNQISDNANQRGELRGERDYQGGLQTQAYNQGVQGLTLEDALTNSAFGRGLASETAGYGNNPADMQAWLSGVYGQQAGQAGQAVSGLIGSTTENNLLKSILGGGGAQQTGQPEAAPSVAPWSPPPFNPTFGGSYTPPGMPKLGGG